MSVPEHRSGQVVSGGVAGSDVEASPVILDAGMLEFRSSAVIWGASAEPLAP